MFSARWIRENGAAFDAGLARRGVEPHAERVIELDARRREALTAFQDRQQARKTGCRRRSVRPAAGARTPQPSSPRSGR